MKHGLLRPQLFILMLAVLSLWASISFGGQVVYGKGAGDGRPTDWDSPSQDFQNHVSAQGSLVKQEKGSSGGGEGKPEDWGSPNRIFLSPLGNLPAASSLTPRSYTISLVLYLFARWF